MIVKCSDVTEGTELLVEGCDGSILELLVLSIDVGSYRRALFPPYFEGSAPQPRIDRGAFGPPA